MSVAVTLDNITLSYERHPAVHHISGVFAAGSLTAIAGPNGAGKSTLLKGIAGVLAPDEGRIMIEGAGREAVAYLPQASELKRDFPMSVAQMVATGTWQQSGYLGAITSAMRAQVDAALAAVGLSGCGGRTLTNLSAGQFQRALFARLIVQDAALILLDEPFTAIDAATTAELLAIIKKWHAEGRTVICVLHDAVQIVEHFPNCLLMAREALGWGASREVLSGERAELMRFFPGGSPAIDICERAS